MDPRPPDDLPPAAPTTVHGARWAVALGTALLVALASMTTVRWLAKPASSVEQIVQIPVTVPEPTPTPRPEVLAPDPGDNP